MRIQSIIVNGAHRHRFAFVFDVTHMIASINASFLFLLQQIAHNDTDSPTCTYNETSYAYNQLKKTQTKTSHYANSPFFLKKLLPVASAPLIA